MTSTPSAAFALTPIAMMPPYSASSALRNYKGVLALNNSGVAFVERRAYKQAMETFQYALFVMRSTVLNTAIVGGGAASQNNNGRVNMEERLEQTNRLLAHPRLVRNLQQWALPSPTVRLNSDLSHQHESFSYLLRNQLSGAASAPFPIRMECADENNDVVNVREAHLEAAILIYNFGVAQLYASRVEPHAAKAQNLCHSAYSVLKFALDGISASAEVAVPYSSSIMEQQQNLMLGTELLQRLLLSTAVVHSIILVLQDMDRPELAREFCTKLLRLRDAIDRVGSILSSPTTSEYCAVQAAAAA